MRWHWVGGSGKIYSYEGAIPPSLPPSFGSFEEKNGYFTNYWKAWAYSRKIISVNQK